MKPFPMLWWWIALLVIFLLSNLPFLAPAWASYLASASDCTLTGGGAAPPCIIDGVDRGQDLQALSYMALYVFISWPLGALLFAVWLIALLVARGRWKRRQLNA